MNTILERLTLASRKVRVVNVPNVEGDVYLKPLSVKDAIDYTEYVQKFPDESEQALLVCLSLCDKDGLPIAGIENIETVRNLDANIVEKLYQEFSTIKEVEVKVAEQNPSNPDQNLDKFSILHYVWAGSQRSNYWTL